MSLSKIDHLFVYPELAKLLDPFNGEGAKMIPYEPANLLILEDNSRNMRRTMELIAMFDSDVLRRIVAMKACRPDANSDTRSFQSAPRGPSMSVMTSSSRCAWGGAMVITRHRFPAASVGQFTCVDDRNCSA